MATFKNSTESISYRCWPILVGMFHRYANGTSAWITILVGLSAMVYGTFFAEEWVHSVLGSGYHYMGVVFVALVALQLGLATFLRRDEPYVQQDSKAVDLTPWGPAKLVGGSLVLLILGIYAFFST